MGVKNMEAAQESEYRKSRSGNGIAHGAKESSVYVKSMEAVQESEYRKSRSGNGIAHGAKEAAWA